ncbi:ArnT family glycosyltransferase [Patescibacteria group bacterium]
MSKKKINILALIVFIALLFRLMGIKHGFPFIFHPDEPTIVRSALGVRFYPNPGHFDWPHLYIYLNYFLYMIFARVRNIAGSLGLREIIPILWDESVIFYLLTRCFTAILGALTTIPVYLSAKKLFSKKVAIVSALGFACLPFHIWHSHYSLSDAPMVFMLSWAMYFGVKIYKEGKLIDYILAGLFVGLSASTKYNGGLSALVIPLAYILRKIQNKKPIIEWREIQRIVISGIVSIAGFILGTPYSVLDFATFTRTDGPKGALWQFKNVGSVSFPEHIIKFFSDLETKLPDDLGYTVLALFVACWIVVVLKIIKKKVTEEYFSLLLFLIPPLLYIWYISGFEKSRSHYYMISYPFIAVVFGHFVLSLSNFFKNKKLGLYLSVLMVVAPMIFSIKNTYTFIRGDTRNDLKEWLVSSLEPGEPIIYNDRKAEDVINHLGAPKYKGLSYMGELERAMVIIINPNEISVPENLSEEHYIGNKLRLGPEIKVYRYETN